MVQAIAGRFCLKLPIKNQVIFILHLIVKIG
jgi:hypothetical protein